MNAPLVSTDGSTWNFHKAGGQRLLLAVADESLVQENLSAKIISMKIKDGPTVVLAVDDDDATQIVVEFTSQQLGQFPGRTTDFVIMNETDNVLLHAGQISVWGFA